VHSLRKNSIWIPIASGEGSPGRTGCADQDAYMGAEELEAAVVLNVLLGGARDHDRDSRPEP
jgi:hypothetical protein